MLTFDETTGKMVVVKSTATRRPVTANAVKHVTADPNVITDMTYGEMVNKVVETLRAVYAINEQMMDNDAELDAVTAETGDAHTAKERNSVLAETRRELVKLARKLAWNIGNETVTAELNNAAQYFVNFVSPVVTSDEAAKTAGIIYVKMASNGKGEGKLVANV